jgi:glycosyltransferase A (GT-A) superfamily protein (DUF2064 family)
MRLVADRLLVVFARAPGREARDKGLPLERGSGFFTAVADGWRRAARRVGAAVAISAPPEDLRAWRRALAGSRDVRWIEQRGASFGARLEDTARRAASLARHAVVTGGDVIPSVAVLEAAFAALASGAGAVLAPSHDGGVSMLSLPEDPDLLRSIGTRRRDVFRDLRRRLTERGREIAIIDRVADVDGLRSLRGAPVTGTLREMASLLRREAAARPFVSFESGRSANVSPAIGSPVLRGPPLPA